MEQQLSDDELESLKMFMHVVNNEIRGTNSGNIMSQRNALKFLVARKFNIQRALQLYQLHEITRLKEGLVSLDPSREPLKAELYSSKFTVLSTRDHQGSAIAIFTAKLHATPGNKNRNTALRDNNHKTTLQGIVYQLDIALETIETQRSGIVFIYNMSGSEYSNFDYDLCQKILNLLKGAYPAKLKKVLIVSPPLWFRAPFHLLRLIVREKLRDRVWMLSTSQLVNHIPSEALPLELGGTLIHNHQEWIEECKRISSDRFEDLCHIASAENLSKISFKQNNGISSNQSIGHSSSDFPLSEEVKESIISCTNSNSLNLTQECNRLNINTIERMPSCKVLSERTEPYDYDANGMSLEQFIHHIKAKGKKGLLDEYIHIKQNDAIGSFEVARNKFNIHKNRYCDVLCYDHSRVKLEPYDTNPRDEKSSESNDYINANYVDGYRQPKAFISTQGPLEKTFSDFWAMIWQTNSRVIVMVTRAIERDRLKCDQYWPLPNKKVIVCGIFTISLLRQDSYDDYNISQLSVTNTDINQSRDIWHFQYTSWPDYGAPLSACALLDFRDQVNRKQSEALTACLPNYPPIVVHCSAGIGRSPTYITLDICIQRLETTGLIEVKDVVEKLREQRCMSIQMPDQYVFCHTSLLEYALSRGLLQDIDLPGFDDEDDNY